MFSFLFLGLQHGLASVEECMPLNIMPANTLGWEELKAASGNIAVADNYLINLAFLGRCIGEYG